MTNIRNHIDYDTFRSFAMAGDNYTVDIMEEFVMEHIAHYPGRLDRTNPEFKAWCEAEYKRYVALDKCDPNRPILHQIKDYITTNNDLVQIFEEWWKKQKGGTQE